MPLELTKNKITIIFLCDSRAYEIFNAYYQYKVVEKYSCLVGNCRLKTKMEKALFLIVFIVFFMCFLEMYYIFTFLYSYEVIFSMISYYSFVGKLIKEINKYTSTEKTTSNSAEVL